MFKPAQSNTAKSINEKMWLKILQSTKWMTTKESKGAFGSAMELMNYSHNEKSNN